MAWDGEDQQGRFRGAPVWDRICRRETRQVEEEGRTGKGGHLGGRGESPSEDSVCGTPVTKPQAGMRAGAPRGKGGRSAEENKVAVAHLSGSQPGWAGSCVRDPLGSLKF